MTSVTDLELQGTWWLVGTVRWLPFNLLPPHQSEISLPLFADLFIKF